VVSGGVVGMDFTQSLDSKTVRASFKHVCKIVDDSFGVCYVSVIISLNQEEMRFGLSSVNKFT